LLLNFALEYAIRKIQENQAGMKPNRTHQLLVYADVNLLGDNMNTVKNNTEALIDVTKEKTKYTLMSCQQNAGQNHNTKKANRPFENVAQFKYSGTTVTNQK
jgi:hypothetical protein